MLVQLNKLMQRKNLTEEECCSLIETFHTNELQAAAILSLLQCKGETVDEISGFVKGLLKHSIPFNTSNECIDIVGTGGDGANTINISTATSMIIASMGVPTVKHGNHASSSKSGSADFIREMGVDLNQDPKQCLDQFNYAYLYAPNFHPIFKNISPIRKKLGIRTVFNLLGPLVNPARPNYYLIGVFSTSILETYAELLLRKNIKRAMIVNSCGLDEISLLGKTQVIEINNGQKHYYMIDPHDYGLPLCTLEDIQGQDAKDNVQKFYAALRGENIPLLNTLVLNTAAALYITSRANSIGEGVEKAQAHLATDKVFNYINLLTQKNESCYA